MNELERFIAAAQQTLHHWDLVAAIATAQSTEGFWHPNGFMVFHTPTPPALHVRVHIWPAHNQRPRPGHPPIHTHVWDLASKIVHGRYRETVHHLQIDSSGPLTRFTVDYHTRDDATVTAEATKLRALASITNTYDVGDIHTLASGQWHESTIDPTEDAVTVMVTGEPQLPHPHLAGPATRSTERHTRGRIDRTLVKTTCERILAAHDS